MKINLFDMFFLFHFRFVRQSNGNFKLNLRFLRAFLDMIYDMNYWSFWNTNYSENPLNP